MAHDEASAGLLHELTDTHLADRARLGDAVAFDELVRRHGRTAVAFATVVTGDLAVAQDVATRSLTDILDQIASGGYSLDDPYLPGLLRSVRELGNAEAAHLAEDNEEMDAFLPELARATRWLTAIQGLDTIDTALALDIEDDSVPALLDWTEELLGDRAAAVDDVLGAVGVAVPLTFAAEARGTWRSWMATLDVTPITRERRERRERGALLPRIEPVATRILRGAAVLLLVAGAAGLVTNNTGSSGSGNGRGGRTEAASSSPSNDSEPVSSKRSINSMGSTGRTGRSGSSAGSSSATDASSRGSSVAGSDRTASADRSDGAGSSTGSSNGGGPSGGSAGGTSGGTSGGATPGGGTTNPGGGGGGGGGTTTPGGGGTTTPGGGGTTTPGGGGTTTPGGGGTPQPTTPQPTTPQPTTPQPTTPQPTTPQPTVPTPTIPGPLGGVLGGVTTTIGGVIPGLGL